MKDEEIEKLRSEYESLIGCKKELLKYAERKKELEETPEVMEYLRVCEIMSSGKGYSYYGVEKLNDDQILDKVISNFIPEEDNKIYICMSKICNIFTYKNIETLDTLAIPKDNVEEFEKENIVIYPNENEDSNVFFYKIRREYYKKAIDMYSDRYAVEYAQRKAFIFDKDGTHVKQLIQLEKMLNNKN